MSSPVDQLINERKEAKGGKMKIATGSVMTTKFETDGGQDKGGKKQKDEDGSGGVCPGCGGEDGVLNPIRKWAFKRNEYLFAHDDIS